jgi:hypothetical protein
LDVVIEVAFAEVTADADWTTAGAMPTIADHRSRRATRRPLASIAIGG